MLVLIGRNDKALSQYSLYSRYKRQPNALNYNPRYKRAEQSTPVSLWIRTIEIAMSPNPLITLM